MLLLGIEHSRHAAIITLAHRPRQSVVCRTPNRGSVCHDHVVATTVLIVDDHAGFRRSARETLEAAGFDVVGEAGDGTAAVSAAAVLRPDVVVLDVQLPDMSGFAVCVALRAANGAAPAIVLVSSREAEEYGPLIDESGARGFVHKADLSGEALAAVLR
jgi:DNA-binding NarL/FixJ family response regulator